MPTYIIRVYETGNDAEPVHTIEIEANSPEDALARVGSPSGEENANDNLPND